MRGRPADTRRQQAIASPPTTLTTPKIQFSNMPGRASVRANRAARSSETSRKSSAQTPKTRGSASTRPSVYAVEIPDEGEATSLRERICGIFSDAQRGVVTQRKSAVNLRKIQELCCYETPNPRKHLFAEDARDYDEADFNEEVGRCMMRVLAVKKSEPIGDRLIKFLGLFLKFSSEKGKTRIRHLV
jgi:condensin complex subunit 3